MKRFNRRHLKRHRAYTVHEIAELLRVHKNTVRGWSRPPTTDDRRPALVLGSDLIAFLTARRASKRRRCGPGQFYCLRCRQPRRPINDKAEYRPFGRSFGNVGATCEACKGRVWRRVSWGRINSVLPGIQIQMKQD